MDKPQIIAALTQWETHCLALESAWDATATATGIPIDGPLGTAVWKMLDGYTRTTADLVGAPPSGVPQFANDLDWYANETHYGQRNAVVYYRGRKRKIDSVTALAKLIIDTASATDHA